jgi:hypothetical protein
MEWLAYSFSGGQRTLDSELQGSTTDLDHSTLYHTHKDTSNL